MNKEGRLLGEDAIRMLGLRPSALRLGVSSHTLRAWVRQRRIAFHRLGRRLVFDVRDLEAFLRANRVEARDGTEP
jgi:excisionase family DNA binding protein